MSETEHESRRRRVDDPWRIDIERKIDGATVAVKEWAEKHEKLATAVSLNNAQTQRMFDVFVAVEGGLLFLGRMYDGVVWLLNKIVKLAKPLIFLGAVCWAAYTWLKTGVWKSPL